MRLIIRKPDCLQFIVCIWLHIQGIYVCVCVHACLNDISRNKMKVTTRQQQTDFLSDYYCYVYSVVHLELNSCIVRWNEEQYIDKLWNRITRRSAKHWFARRKNTLKWSNRNKNTIRSAKWAQICFWPSFHSQVLYTYKHDIPNQTDMRVWMKIFKLTSTAQTTKLSVLKFFYMVCMWIGHVFDSLFS